MNVALITEELGSPENLKDWRVRRLVQALLEEWLREWDHQLENLFFRELSDLYADSIQDLLELNQNKNSLLGMASHDLRNPLLSIRGLAEILLTEVAGQLSSDQKEYLSIISSASNGMLGLVNDLLDVSVIESGRLSLNRVEGSYVSLAAERVRVYGAIAEEKGIQLTGQFGEIPDFAFDPVRMGQVMDNLLSNAVKFSPPGSEVRVLLEGEGKQARFTVVDEGPGIPQEDLSRIFLEFEKSRGNPTGGEASTGLGLAIAKKIVEAHAGRILAYNREGSGAVFSFSIPF